MVADFNKQHPSNVFDTIAWLLRLRRPPLPECPIEAAKQGKEPKQPCYFDGKRVIPISWKQWQNEQPIAEIYKTWFANAKNGIGTLGGWNGKHWLGWIDFDQKDFSSPQECDVKIAEWLSAYPIMADAPMFRTPSGGYRFLVAFDKEPENFKANSGFSLNPDGSHHVGELLTKNGGHTLLPPTIGVNGKPYKWEYWTEYPPVVDSPEDIGLYLVQKRTETKKAVASVRENKSDETSLTELLKCEIYPRITSDVAFCWSGHDFKTSGDKLRGNCPWHDSQSGTAFYVNSKDGEWVWRCPACEIGGGVIEYRHRLNGGSGSPRGKDFVEIVRQLANDVGAAFPEFSKTSFSNEPESQQNNGKYRNVVELPNTKRQADLTTEQLKEKLLDLIKAGASQSFIEGVIPELAEQSGRKDTAIHRLLGVLQSELEHRQSLSDDSEQFKKLVQHQARKLDVNKIFPAPLAKALESKAVSDRIDPVRLVQNLLPAVGSILGSKVGIVAKEGETRDDDWVELPVLWAVDVGSPSSGKSNANNTVFDPIKQLQAEEARRYKEACEELKKIEKAWEGRSVEEREHLKDTHNNPEVFKTEVVGVKRKWLFDIAEMEAVLRRLSEQSPTTGVVWNKDELQGLFSGLDQYKSGSKGNARQTLLSAWNGRIRIDIDRVKEEESYSLNGQTLSITGGMQPGVAREFFKSKTKNGEPDPDGLQSRILPAVPSIPQDFAVWSDVKVSINSILTELYQKLDEISSGSVVSFDNQAQKVWKQQWEKFKEGYLRYLDSNPAFAYFLGKMPSHLPRLVLVLHCIEHCFTPKVDFNKVGLDTLNKAIELAGFYIGQFRLLQATTQDGEGQLEGVILRVWNKATEKGRLSIRDAQQSFRSLKLKAPAIKEIFQVLVERGYGYLEDGGKTLVDQKDVHPVDPVLIVDQQRKETTNTNQQANNVDHVDQMLIHDQQPVNLTGSRFQPIVDHVDPKNLPPQKNVESISLEVEHDCCTPPDCVSLYEGDQHDQQIDETLARQQVQDVDPRSTDDQQDQQNNQQTQSTNIAADLTQAAPDDSAATDHSLKVGDRVLWNDCPGHCSWGNPFIITAIKNNDMAELDLIDYPVPLLELRRLI